MSQVELSRRTGIATSTISDWRKKGINPQADKLVSICRALDMSLVDLLCDDEMKKQVNDDFLVDDHLLIERISFSSVEIKRQLIQYYELLLQEQENNNRNVSIVQDIDGNKIVVINDIIFKGRQNINWDDVEEYVKRYIGDFVEVTETKDIIYIGKELPDEYAGSKYTARLKGALAKAKANAAQGIPELIEIATNKRYQNNLNDKHNKNAKYGWYRYDSRFALPIYDESGDVVRYNVFSVVLIVRHSKDGKLYLYDIINAKKEAGTPL